MCQDGLRDLRPHIQDRIQRGHRLLENHGDARTSNSAQLLVVERREVQAFKQDASANDTPRGTDKPKNGHGGDALPAAAFSNKSQGLALVERERYAIDSLDDSVVRRKVCLKIVNLENMGSRRQETIASRYSP